VGFSYAMECVCREAGVDLIQEARQLRHGADVRLAAEQPPCVRDRFAFYTQTLRLTRPEIEHLRAAIFETED